VPQLIIALILIVLYILLIRWLFISVGPPFIYVSAIAFSMAVPYAYIKNLIGTFGRPAGLSAPRNWLFVFVIALTALIQIDLLFLALGFGMQMLRVSFAWELQRTLGEVVWSLAGNREVLAAAVAFLPESSYPVGHVLFSSAVKSALIVPWVLLIRGLKSPILDPRQPAYVSYFHAQAFKDLGTLIRGMGRDLLAALLMINRGIVAVTMAGSLFVWPLTVMAYVALVPPVIIAAVAALLFVGMHTVALSVVWLLAMGISFVLSAAERAVILARAGYAKCPHSECHAPVPLPVFLCPQCDTEHDRLIPGRFGVLRRRCKCGVGNLPTLFWTGKGRLRMKCPKCRKAMREELFSGGIHVPIYGGPSAGKTMFMMAASWELLEGKVPGVRSRLIDEATERAYSRYWKPDFETGRVREKTVQPFPDAFLLSMRRGLGFPTSVYLYDPAGEAMLSDSSLDAHRFMDYYDGLALLIDPLSLPSFADEYRASGGPDLSATTSRAHPSEAVTRVINMLERFGTLSRKRGLNRRIAVVFTKADVPGFREEVGRDIDRARALDDDWQALGSSDSAEIRAWFARCEPHLVQVLETRFAEIRYFAISALGHIPEGGQKRFTPRKVMEPLAWLLSTRSTFAHPFLGRILGRTMEATAVAAVLGVFVVVPACAIWYWLQ
jgi:hypothetical protein